MTDNHYGERRPCCDCRYFVRNEGGEPKCSHPKMFAYDIVKGFSYSDAKTNRRGGDCGLKGARFEGPTWFERNWIWIALATLMFALVVAGPWGR